MALTEEIRAVITDLQADGMEKREIVDYLKDCHDVPPSTGYRYVKEVEREQPAPFQLYSIDEYQAELKEQKEKLKHLQAEAEADGDRKVVIELSREITNISQKLLKLR